MNNRRVAAVFFAAVSLMTPGVDGEPGKAVDVTAGHEKIYVGQPIDMSLRDADLVETLRTFAEIGGFNLILDPSVQGTVTVELKGVPWDQALEQILKINNLGMDVSGTVVEVGTPRALTQRQRLAIPRTVSLTLRHADAAVLARVIGKPESGILTAEGRVWTEPGNTLVVKDTGVRLMHLGRLFTRLDVPSAASETPVDLGQRCLASWQELTTD